MTDTKHDQNTEEPENSDNDDLTHKSNAVVKSDVPEEVTKAEASSSKVEAPTKTKGNGIAWFALLIAIVALGLAGYLGWFFLQQKDITQSLGNQASTQRNQTQELQNALSGSESRLMSQFSPRDAEITKLKSSLVEAHLALDAHSRRLLSLTATTTDDWRLAEVEYLLRLANQRILTSKDGQTALNLLTSSDQILLELGDPRLFKVRESIANDRAALAVVSQQDLEGVFLELSALSNQINALPVLVVPTFDAEPKLQGDEETSQQKETPLWLQKLQSIWLATWSELKSLIVIQKNDLEIKPLLPPEQKFYLKSHLRLLISQAQLALLDGRQHVFSEALVGAVGWLEDYFPQEESANQEMVSALKRLSKVVVTTEYPDVSNSLIAIKAFIAEQHRVSQGHVKSVGKSANSKKGESALPDSKQQIPLQDSPKTQNTGPSQ